MYCVAVSPDSQFIISGACGRAADGVVRIWTAAGDFVRKLQGKTCVLMPIVYTVYVSSIELNSFRAL